MPKKNKNKNKNKPKQPAPAVKRGGRTPTKTILVVSRTLVPNAGFLPVTVDTNNVTQAALNHVNLTRGSTEFKIRNVKTNVSRFGQDAVVTAQCGPVVLDMAATLAHHNAKSCGGDLTMTTPSTTGWESRKRAYVHVIAPQHSVVETRTTFEVRDAPTQHL